MPESGCPDGPASILQCRDAHASDESCALREPFDRGRGGPGAWRILVEPELHFAKDVLVPDLAGWRRGRLPRLPETAYVQHGS